MNNPDSTVNSYALHDILLGIAESLNEAEQQLRNQPPYDAFGRPNTIYQLPYLDFNLQVTTEFESIDTVETTGDAGTTATSDKYERRMLYSPAPRETATAKSSSDSNRTEIYSSISGRFVANVPNEGLPQVILLTTRTEVDATTDPTEPTFSISATVSNAASELLPNTKVEFNFDEARTLKLNSEVALSAPPAISIGEVITGSDASATVWVILPAAEYADTDEIFFVFILNVGPVTKLISISNKS
jgi:multidrug efflux pump subunit AcrA (membrane-fusion protein)